MLHPHYKSLLGNSSSHCSWDPSSQIIGCAWCASWNIPVIVGHVPHIPMKHLPVRKKHTPHKPFHIVAHSPWIPITVSGMFQECSSFIDVKIVPWRFPCISYFLLKKITTSSSKFHWRPWNPMALPRKITGYPTLQWPFQGAYHICLTYSLGLCFRENSLQNMARNTVLTY